VIEQARLRVEAMQKQRLEEEQRQLERELGLARGIQMSLLPPAALRLGPWEVLGHVMPARHVGGDAFDYFALGEDRLALAIADVSGKGVPAALLMANLQASLRAFCDGRLPIPEAIRLVNQSVVRSSSGKFVTLFYGEIEIASGTLRYVNAGHNYPLFRRRDGNLVELAEGGLPLGILETADYTQGEISTAPGDSLLLFSDGVTEALDARGQEFGDDRLRRLWEGRGERTPREMVDLVLSDVETFRGMAVQSDDITLVVGAHR
jgi:sigma-B regulation protein RsbU (phosphoserine phosphatase)